MHLRGLDVLGVSIPDDQARTAGLVLIGVVAALLVLLLTRRTRRLVLGLALTAAVIVGITLAVRTGMIPDPRSLVPGLPS